MIRRERFDEYEIDILNVRKPRTASFREAGAYPVPTGVPSQVNERFAR